MSALESCGLLHSLLIRTDSGVNARLRREIDRALCMQRKMYDCNDPPLWSTYIRHVQDMYDACDESPPSIDSTNTLTFVWGSHMLLNRKYRQAVAREVPSTPQNNALFSFIDAVYPCFFSAPPGCAPHDAADNPLALTHTIDSAPAPSLEMGTCTALAAAIRVFYRHS